MFGRKNHFGKKINKNKISRQIFDNVDTPILVMNENQQIVMVNPAAERFFEIAASDENATMHQLFDVTREDAKKWFCNITGGLYTEDCRMVAKKSKAVCKLSVGVIRERRTVYVIIFVYDMTADNAAIESLRAVISSLEKALAEKSRQAEAVALHAVTTVANFIDSKEEYNQGHSARVAKYAQAIAQELGWSAQEARNIHYVALLHDIGKIGIPIELLNKKTALTSNERELIKQHTIIGAQILKDITMVENIREGALYHHERYDGTGYPEGMEGQDIPMAARIIAIADAVDAMTNDRKYKESLTDEEAKEEIERLSGKQFDPYIASVVVRMFEEGIFAKLRTQTDPPTPEDIILESNTLMARVIKGESAVTGTNAEID